MTKDKLIKPSVASVLFGIQVKTIRDLAKAEYISAYTPDSEVLNMSKVVEGATTDKFVYDLEELERFFGKKILISSVSNEE